MYEDHDGMFTFHCSTKEKALVAFQKCLDEYVQDYPEDSDHLKTVVLDINQIQEDRMYSHRNCDGGYMIGEPICWDCGEPTSHFGRLTFTYAL